MSQQKKTRKKKAKRKRKSLSQRLAESEEKRVAAEATAAKHEDTIRQLGGVRRVLEKKVEDLSGKMAGFEHMLINAQTLIGQLVMQSDKDKLDLVNIPPHISAWSCSMEVDVKAVNVDGDGTPERKWKKKD